MDAYPFTPGLQLSGFLYEEAVRPILASHFPGLLYSAGRIGAGSEVLGFDTPQSMDHDWGPKLQLFLAESDFEPLLNRIEGVLRQELPASIHGIPIDLAWARSSEASHGPAVGDPAHHGVSLHTLHSFLKQGYNIDPTAELTPADWLSVPQQHLRSLVSGAVFTDGLGLLEPLRTRLRWYPHDLWLYQLAAQWQRISQEEPFMGRCGQAGDELGSRLVAARLVRDMVRLGFLMERQYAPYIKWLGTAFNQLKCARTLAPLFEQILKAGYWQEREAPLVEALETMAAAHNRLGLTTPLSARAATFHNRPFMVIQGERFAEALLQAIQSEVVRSLPIHLGSVDQFVDSTDALDRIDRLEKLKTMYANTPLTPTPLPLGEG